MKQKNLLKYFLFSLIFILNSCSLLQKYKDNTYQDKKINVHLINLNLIEEKDQSLFVLKMVNESIKKNFIFASDFRIPKNRTDNNHSYNLESEEHFSLSKLLYIYFEFNQFLRLEKYNKEFGVLTEDYTIKEKKFLYMKLLTESSFLKNLIQKKSFIEGSSKSFKVFNNFILATNRFSTNETEVNNLIKTYYYSPLWKDTNSFYEHMRKVLKILLNKKENIALLDYDDEYSLLDKDLDFAKGGLEHYFENILLPWKYEHILKNLIQVLNISKKRDMELVLLIRPLSINFVEEALIQLSKKSKINLKIKN